MRCCYLACYLLFQTWDLPLEIPKLHQGEAHTHSPSLHRFPGFVSQSWWLGRRLELQIQSEPFAVLSIPSLYTGGFLSSAYTFMQISRIFTWTQVIVSLPFWYHLSYHQNDHNLLCPFLLFFITSSWLTYSLKLKYLVVKLMDLCWLIIACFGYSKTWHTDIQGHIIWANKEGIAIPLLVLIYTTSNHKCVSKLPDKDNKL